ncbi:unnamed protein product [Dibothriocephalus latus]|uniref:Uncharacterized protein n=1 Tax=Dibothriocephalus latus TaxID=60516 RepID=A0A3P6TN45_DIBLA|nr:unnamed protein product [Dibothriocephalus latus]
MNDTDDTRYLVVMSLALLLLILGVAIPEWECGGVLSTCGRKHSCDYLGIGVVLCLAIVLVELALIFITVDLGIDYK